MNWMLLLEWGVPILLGLLALACIAFLLIPIIFGNWGK